MKKRTCLLLFLCLILTLISCNKKDDNTITYTSEDIYLKFAGRGYISGFPKELLIFESEEQLECALNLYENIASLMDLDAVTEEYPIGEYIYLLQYFETDIDSKVECKGLNVNKEEMWIRFEHKIKSPKEGPTAITAYVTYAALPKEYLAGCDFSAQQGVLYLGKNADTKIPTNENQGGEPEAVRNLNCLEIIIGDTYSPEVTPAPANAWEEATGKYREEIMETHNCIIAARKVADWDEMQEVFISSVEAGEPVAQVFELDYRFLAKPLSMGLFYDLTTLEELGVSLNEREHKNKWSPAVNKLMTKGKSIYGMRSEWMEPGGGIIFNKRLFEEAGLDPNLPYDLQARGEWTWSKFEELCEVLTRDTDGDGQTDVYATCSDGTDTLQCLVSSTGEDFIGVDKDVTIYNNCKSESVLGAMEYAATLYEKGYEMPAPADGAEDWYITAFQNGKAAMQFAEESLCRPDAPYGRNNMTDEIGFVVPPKPDGQEEYYTYVYGNVWVIPSCYDTETAADIAFAYNLYTNETPGYNDPVSYQEAYYSDFEDERACDETLPYYNDKRMDTVNFLTCYLVDGLDISDLTKSYPFTEKTPEACVDEVWDSWQVLIDRSNGKNVPESDLCESE